MRSHLTLTDDRAAEVAIDWICATIERSAPGDTALLLQGCAAAALCHHLAAERRGVAHEVCALALDRLGATDARSLRRSDGTMVLLCAALAVELFGAAPPALAAQAREVAGALADLPMTADPDFRPASWLLARMGLGLASFPASAALEEPLLPLLLGDDAAVRGTVERIENGSVYGVFPATAPDGLSAVLDAIAMRRLALYDIPLACRLVRAATYAGRGDGLACRTARTFLLTNQAADGSFGFFERELALLRSERSIDEATLKLPVTLTCLWTLAETRDDGYRLFAPMPGANARGA